MRNIIFLLSSIVVSFVFAVIGNGVVYDGFPELPNILFVFFHGASGESAYDFIYYNAFLWSFLAVSAVFPISFYFRRIRIRKSQKKAEMTICFRCIAVFIGLAAAIFAKNSISFPLSYDYSCSYGFPMAWLEIHSVNSVQHMGLASQAYRTNANLLAMPSVWINILIDILVCALIYWLLQNDRKKFRGQKILRRLSRFLFVLFALILWTGILAPWETRLYSHCYLAGMVLLGGIILLGAMKLVFYKIFEVKNELAAMIVFSLSALGLFGCRSSQCGKVNFVGMSREQAAAALQQCQKREDGKFVIHHFISSCGQLVYHDYKDSRSLLASPNAVSSSQWRAGFHPDPDGTWHSYILFFDNDMVVRQEERHQPCWVMAE